MMLHSSLRKDWDMIHFLENEGYTGEYLKELKQGVREHNRQKDIDAKRRIFCQDMDGFIVREEFDSVFSAEDVQEYMNENWLYCRNSAYDCTGDAFTCGIDVFPLPKVGKTVVYHRVGFDV